MRLVKLTDLCNQNVYVNPDAVFFVRHTSDERTCIGSSNNDLLFVTETVCEVVNRLTNPITVDLPSLASGQKVTITSNTDEEVIIKAPANVTYTYPQSKTVE